MVRVANRFLSLWNVSNFCTMRFPDEKENLAIGMVEKEMTRARL